MGSPRFITASLAAVATALIGAAVSVAAPTSDTIVSVGSPDRPFSQNKQNEPAVAIDANNPDVVAGGSNDEIDMESCAAGSPTTCPFTPGVGVSGIYFSFTGGSTWTQPTYQGLTARDCAASVPCLAHTGKIGTLPGYAAAGLVADGDPALAFGPRPDANGKFSYNNGSRLYYANLTSNVGATRATETFKGFEAIAVSRVDNVTTSVPDAAAWKSPVIISKQSSTTFSDKEQIWADNASSSRFFGNVYVCWASFRSNSHGNALPTPLTVARSTDGGTSWTTSQVGPATDNRNNAQADGCTVRTDSTGNAYIFGVGARNGRTVQMMYKSTDGGAHWVGPTIVATAVAPGVLDPVLGRPVMDGMAGARVDLAVGPSVDIANGAPTGAGATNEIFMTWADGSKGLNNEHLMLTRSTNGGASWVSPAVVPLTAGDRPIYTAPAVSPDGTDLYIVHNSYTKPFQKDTSSVRGLVGEVLHADVADGAPSAFSTLHRGVEGDPRGTSQNGLTAEFLGDYVYAAATNDAVVGVWNDARNADVCPSVNAYRASLYTASPTAVPDVLGTCTPAPANAPRFGNSDIYGGRYADPTP